MTARALVPSRAEGAAVLGAAALFAFAFPPFPFVVPAVLALVPLAIAAEYAAEGSPRLGDRARTGARLGFWFGALAYGANIYWIASALSLFTRLAFLAYLAAVVLLGMVMAAIVATLVVARGATRLPLAVVLPIVWTAGELLLAHLGDLAFPWLPLGLATAPVPVLAQIADVSGVHGTSFVMAGMAGLLADAWLNRDRAPAVAWRLGAVAGVAAAVGAYGWWRTSTIRLLPIASVAVVQPDVPQDEKWDEANQERIVGILASTTRQALAHRPKLVVWPETALPDFLFRHPAWRDTLAALTAPTGTPLVAGVLDVQFHPPRTPDYFNGAVLVDGDGRITQPPYRKRRLVPVVERVPFVAPRWLAALGDYAGGYARGTGPVVLQAPIGALGVLICYESAFPDLAREYRRGGAELLVSMTNDAWFGRSTAPYQHFAHLSLRAIETRMPVVRSANTGISGYIDPLGRVEGETPLFVRAAPTYLIDRTDAVSPFVRLGDWVGTSSAAASIALLAYAVGARTRGAA